MRPGEVSIPLEATHDVHPDHNWTVNDLGQGRKARQFWIVKLAEVVTEDKK